MRLIAQKTLNDFARRHPDAAGPIADFALTVKAAKWQGMDQIVQLGIFKASPIDNERVVFNIGGNKYRLICSVLFELQVVYVKWYGTHAEYDDIDAAAVTFFNR